MKTLSSQEIINAHKNLQHALYQYDRYKRSIVSDVDFLRTAAQRVEEYKKHLPVESTESQEKTDYVAEAEKHLAECLKGNAKNSPRPADYVPGMYGAKPELPLGGAPQNPDADVSVTKGAGGLQKF
jgi:hypothetical protein